MIPLPHVAASTPHTDEQPSPSMGFPSSHCSFSSIIALPHGDAGFEAEPDGSPNAQVALQPSSPSHCSPVSMTPSPQTAGEQVKRQAPDSMLEFFSPSSHDSPKSPSTMPSPHTGKEHDVRHTLGVASELPFPLSHSSP